MEQQSIPIITFIFGLILMGKCDAQSFSIFRNDLDTSTDQGRTILVDDDEIICVNALWCRDIDAPCNMLISYNSDGDELWKKRIDLNVPNFQRFLLKNDTITSISHGIYSVDSTFVIKGIQYSTDGDSLRTVTSNFPDDSIEYWWHGVSSDEDYYYAYGQKAYRIEGQTDSTVAAIMVFDHDLQIEKVYEKQLGIWSEMHSVKRGPDDRLYGIMKWTETFGGDSIDIIRVDEVDGSFEVISRQLGNVYVTLPDLEFSKDGSSFYQTAMDETDYDIYDIEPDSGVDQDPEVGIKKYRLDGEWEWRRMYGNNPISEGGTDHEIWQTTVTHNGDLLICGQYSVANSFFPYRNSGWICRLSPDGEVIWSRSYPMINDLGENRESELWDIAEMDDGSIVATGWAEPWEDDNPDNEFWLLKVGADGCYDGVHCPDLMVNDSTGLSYLTSVETPIFETLPLELIPNPASDYVQITLPEPLSGYISVRTADGMLVKREQIAFANEHTIDISEIIAGIYLVEFVAEDGRRFVERVVVY